MGTPAGFGSLSPTLPCHLSSALRKRKTLQPVPLGTPTHHLHESPSPSPQGRRPSNSPGGKSRAVLPECHGEDPKGQQGRVAAPLFSKHHSWRPIARLRVLMSPNGNAAEWNRQKTNSQVAPQKAIANAIPPRWGINMTPSNVCDMKAFTVVAAPQPLLQPLSLPRPIDLKIQRCSPCCYNPSSSLTSPQRWAYGACAGSAAASGWWCYFSIVMSSLLDLVDSLTMGRGRGTNGFPCEYQQAPSAAQRCSRWLRRKRQLRTRASATAASSPGPTAC